MPRAFVSIGSNVERERHVRAGVAMLEERLGPLRLSRVYESDPVGFEGEPFYNLACGFESDDDVAALVRALRAVEDLCGRCRGGPRFGPRTLDLDLLLLGDRVIDSPVTLPRPEVLTCAFVLGPLAEIAGDLVHPVVGRPLRELWVGFDRAGQRIRPTRFEVAPRVSGRRTGT